LILTIRSDAGDIDVTIEQQEFVAGQTSTSFLFEVGSRKLDSTSSNLLERGVLKRIRVAIQIDDAGTYDLQGSSYLKSNFYTTFEDENANPVGILMVKGVLNGQQQMLGAELDVEVLPDQELQQVVKVQQNMTGTALDFEATKIFYSMLSTMGCRTVYSNSQFDYLKRTGFFRKVSSRQVTMALISMALQPNVPRPFFTNRDMEIVAPQEMEGGSAAAPAWIKKIGKVVKSVGPFLGDVVGLLNPELGSLVKKGIDMIPEGKSEGQFDPSGGLAGGSRSNLLLGFNDEDSGFCLDSTALLLTPHSELEARFRDEYLQTEDHETVVYDEEDSDETWDDAVERINRVFELDRMQTINLAEEFPDSFPDGIICVIGCPGRLVVDLALP
jgi:hypothetical protein